MQRTSEQASRRGRMVHRAMSGKSGGRRAIQSPRGILSNLSVDLLLFALAARVLDDEPLPRLDDPVTGRPQPAILTTDAASPSPTATMDAITPPSLGPIRRMRRGSTSDRVFRSSSVAGQALAFWWCKFGSAETARSRRNR